VSRRPINDKKLARLEKLVTRRPLPARIDLIQWLMDRKHAQTKREADLLLRSGHVRSESHIVGRVQADVNGLTMWVAQPLVDASLRKTLRFQP
jgi:hypothetical protein